MVPNMSVSAVSANTLGRHHPTTEDKLLCPCQLFSPQLFQNVCVCFLSTSLPYLSHLLCMFAFRDREVTLGHRDSLENL